LEKPYSEGEHQEAKHHGAESPGRMWQYVNQRMSGFRVIPAHKPEDRQDHGRANRGSRGEHQQADCAARCFVIAAALEWRGRWSLPGQRF